MKRKGFTLIELLAVIVVLAIIALIATPIVMNVIKKASAGAAERSADNYIKAVETLIATEKLDGTPIVDGKYEIDGEGKLTLGENSYEVEVSGTKPVGGTITIENGQVVKDDTTTIDYEDYIVKFEGGKAGVIEKETTISEFASLCNYVSGTKGEVGAKYTCNFGDGNRTFYILETGINEKSVTLILEGNYDDEKLPWCQSVGNNKCAASGLTTKLDEIADAWTKIDRSQIGIPSIEQIVVADGQDEDAYLDYPTLSSEWLYKNADGSSVGHTGYWTSTPYGGDTESVWLVYYDGMLNDIYANNHGVRPIITLSI